MRENLFRGKDEESGKWVYGYYVHFFDSYKGHESYRIYPGNAESECVGTNDESWFADWYEVDPATVGEYTGLKDKNGTYIFEDDIVRGKIGLHGSPNLPLKEFVFLVEWENGGFNELSGSDYDDFYEFEVIGNIHENPELVTV